MRPCLFVSTARAGSHNHVDLHPPGIPVPDDLAWLVGQVTGKGLTSGKHYLASTRKVLQSTTGRTGFETILLYGVDVEQLTREGRKEMLQAALGQLGGEVADMVTQRIDWTRCGPAPVERIELAEWMQQLEQVAGDKALPVVARHGARMWIWSIAGLLAFSLLVGLLLAQGGGKGKDKAGSGKDGGGEIAHRDKAKDKGKDKAESGKGGEPDTDLQQCLKSLANKWSLKPEQVEQVIKKTCELKDARLEKEIKELVEVVKKDLDMSYYHFVKAESSFGQLKQLASKLSPDNVKNHNPIREVREFLHEMAPGIKDLIFAASDMPASKPPEKADYSATPSLYKTVKQVNMYVETLKTRKKDVERIAPYLDLKKILSTKPKHLFDKEDCYVANAVLVVLQQTCELIRDYAFDLDKAHSPIIAGCESITISQGDDKKKGKVREFKSALSRILSTKTSTKGALATVEVKYPKVWKVIIKAK